MSIVDKLIRKLVSPYRQRHYYEDLIQDSYMEVEKCRAKFKGDSKFTTYLYLSLKGFIINRVKYYSNIIRIPRNNVSLNFQIYGYCPYDEIPLKPYDKHVACDTVETSDDFIRREFNYNLSIAKSLLSDKEYNYVLLYIQGYSMAEIGRFESVSRETISQRFKKIKEKLKGKYEEGI